MLIDELIKFARTYHEGFANVPDDFLRRMFETYKETTIVNYVDGEILGFGIYQEWPELLNFICIVGNPADNRIQNIIALMDAKEKIPDKRIVFFDETEMRLRTCRQ